MQAQIASLMQVQGQLQAQLQAPPIPPVQQQHNVETQVVVPPQEDDPNVLCKQFRKGGRFKNKRQKNVARSKEKPVCETCGKAHRAEECWRTIGAYLICGSMKHKMSQCPRARRGDRTPGQQLQQQRQGQPPRQPQQDRRQVAGMACTISREQADVATNMVEGMILVDNRLTIVFLLWDLHVHL